MAPRRTHSHPAVGKALTIIVLFFIQVNLLPAQRQITGKVIHTTDAAPIRNVKIEDHTSSTVAYTDDFGIFRITVSPSAETLNVSCANMRSTRIRLNDSTLYFVTLEPLDQSVEIITASLKREPITESPVPVSIITEEDIRLSGAKNMKELLITFVPGFTPIEDHNEMNVAVSGTYASSQQKVLILLNGHRLNSRAYSQANPDYSISLEKIKQIEVLRGPASSLYGNVALTAVINIITKSGESINGAQVAAGLGNHGQRAFSFLLGEHFNNNFDFSFWFSLYKASGELFDIAAHDDHSPNPRQGWAILEGINDRPSYDIGFESRFGKFTLLGNSRACNYISPFTAGGDPTGEIYNSKEFDYNDYRKFLGIGPGLSSGFNHFNLGYENPLSDKFSLAFNVYLDHNSNDVYLVTNPVVQSCAIVSWREYAYGTTLQTSYSYDTRRLGSGTFTCGIQTDIMQLYDSFYASGTGGELTTIVDRRDSTLLEIGNESTASAFIQFKHRAWRNWILNTGLRFDEKIRKDREIVTSLNPRIALIFNFNPRFSLKTSVSSAFVDAPYWYRFNTLPSYLGSQGLKPEKLKAVQLSGIYSEPAKGLNFSLTLYHKQLSNFIIRDPKALPQGPFYINAEGFSSIGLEGEFAWRRPQLQFISNLTLQKATQSSTYPATGNRIHNVPGLYGNALLMYCLSKKNDHWWTSLSARYIGKQLSPLNTYLNGTFVANPEHEIPGVIVIHTGLRMQNIRGVSLDIRLYNTLDTKYTQGGSVKFPYPQPGRWIMVKAGIRFSDLPKKRTTKSENNSPVSEKI